jgi:PTS system nitrogen regulatory IIA component
MSDQTKLALQHIQVLRGEPLLSKKRLFERSAELLSEELGLHSQAIYRALLDREKLGSTAIGEGVAIPHCRAAQCKEPAGCLVILQEPLDYGSPDGSKVDIVFVLLVPEEATEEHLHLLAGLARSFSHDSVRSGIREAQSAEQTKAILLQGATT